MSESIDPRAGANKAGTAERRRSPATPATNDGGATALERYFASVKSIGEAHVEFSVLSDRSFLNVRLDPRQERAIEAAERVLEQSIPLAPNTFTTGEHRVYWLGPDEWLVKTDAERAADLGGELAEALAEFHAAVNDFSGGYVALRVSGPRRALGSGQGLHPGPAPARVRPRTMRTHRSRQGNRTAGRGGQHANLYDHRRP